MLHTRTRIPKLTFDRAGYTKTLNRTMGQIIRQGARLWLETVAPLVPIQTGMARASLIPLADYLHVSLEVDPLQGFKSRVELGIDAGQGFVLIDDNMSTWRYSFAWKTEVLHYLLNDVYGTPTVISSPWNSVEHGDEVMWDYLYNEIPRRLPKMAKFIIKTKASYNE